MYAWLLFGHLLGMALLIGGVSAYALSVEQLRRTRTVDDVRLLLRIASLGERLLIAGGPLLIGAGLGLAARFWSFSQGWIATAIGLVAFQGLWSLIVEVRIRRLRAVVDQASSRTTDADLRRATRDPVLPIGNRFSAAVIIEILYLMTVKPAAAGIVWSLLVAAGGVTLACLPILARHGRNAGDAGDSPTGREPHAATNRPGREPSDDLNHAGPHSPYAAPNHAEVDVPHPAPGIIPLNELRRADSGVAGAKAAALGELSSAGFPVPEGFVVTGEADEDVAWTAASPDNIPLAVRSSAIAEDRADASFAGQYETVLDVRGADALRAAIHRVRDSARGTRVQHYRTERSHAEDDGIAVLVQRMLAPEAAGVAFTANPVTGARDEILIVAARGLGERVVSGEAVGDEWLVRDDEPVCHRSVEAAIDPVQVRAVAQLARRAADYFGVPQDIEWAIEAGRLYLLQTRPMTALPVPVAWTPPSPGYWMRNFRLGEWLPEPMTPLFQSWLLERLAQGYLVGMRRSAGAAVPWRHAAINGWYYTAAPNPRSIPVTLLRAVVQSRGRVLPFVLNALVRVSRRPEAADRAVLGRLAQEWREELLPRYQRFVAEGERRIDTATTDELAELIDSVGQVAGEYLWSLAIVGGSAWKMEGCLAQYLRKHVPTEAYENVQVLLRGLAGTVLEVPAHAVQSVDWYWPTAGELSRQQPVGDLRERRSHLAAEREKAEDACRAALSEQPAPRARFETLLDVAQRYTALREEQARWLTLSWPLLRRCTLRLGEHLRANEAIDGVEDIFFLTRTEVVNGVSGMETPVRDVASHRRTEWERQRRLVAPLAIGRASLAEVAIAGVVNAVRTDGLLPPDAIVGQPASPGRATGPVRIVRGADDFDRFRPGEVLVARATTPAWTPLFGRAVAVVTDGGTLAAHASLVAREYGIPAVVGTGDATVRLMNGQVVVVDGSAGTVQPE